MFWFFCDWPQISDSCIYIAVYMRIKLHGITSIYQGQLYWLSPVNFSFFSNVCTRHSSTDDPYDILYDLYTYVLHSKTFTSTSNCKLELECSEIVSVKHVPQVTVSYKQQIIKCWIMQVYTSACNSHTCTRLQRWNPRDTVFGNIFLTLASSLCRSIFQSYVKFTEHSKQ